jgi:hypothetical protein
MWYVLDFATNDSALFYVLSSVQNLFRDTSAPKKLCHASVTTHAHSMSLDGAHIFCRVFVSVCFDSHIFSFWTTHVYMNIDVIYHTDKHHPPLFVIISSNVIMFCR